MSIHRSSHDYKGTIPEDLQNLSDLNISPEEARKLQEAFENPEFHQLFSNYITEVSDPNYRTEQNEYLQLLESQKELPKGKSTIFPSPGFVIKFQQRPMPNVANGEEHDGSMCTSPISSLFVNIVYSEKVGIPASTDSHLSKRKEWSIPHLTGALRMEYGKDKNGTSILVPTMDCCFHPQALKFASHNTGFRELIADIARDRALEVLNREHQSSTTNNRRPPEISISKIYRILKGIRYKSGIPPAMLYETAKLLECCDTVDRVSQTDYYECNEPRENSQPIATEAQSEALENRTMDKPLYHSFGKETLPIKKSEHGLVKGFLNSKPKVKLCSDIKPSESSAFKRECIEEEEDRTQIPKYQITEQSDFDLASHATANNTNNSQSRRVVVQINLPGIRSSKDVDLDINDRKLTLYARNPLNETKYKLNVDIPYDVDSNHGTAKFHSKIYELVVTIPIREKFIQ